MSEPNNHIYTSDDIRRYHSGAMSKAEMHAMEKAALADPFLADAMEGYMHSSDFNADLVEIKGRLNEKLQGAKVVSLEKKASFGWMRIAALFIVLAGAGWLVFKMSSGENNELAVQKSPAQDNQVPLQDDNTLITPKGMSTQDSIETSVPEFKESPLTVSAPKSKSGNAGREVAVGNISRSLPPVETIGDSKEEEKDSVYSLETKADVADVKPQAPAHYLNAQPGLNNLSGLITDEKRNAIPYASVIVKNFSGTLTDEKGRFQLAVPDTATAVDVNALGFKSRNIELKDAKASEPIVLEPATDDKLQEVVLAKKGSYREKNTPARKSIIEIGELEPVGGWPAYNTYISEKLEIKEQSQKRSKTIGIVQLCFDVDEEGNPYNITVEKSLSPTYDKEAIRLLKEGPKWQKQEGKGKISIRF
jgi:hypothetical protein